MTTLHSFENNSNEITGASCENPSRDDSLIFCQIMAEEISNLLDINWQDRPIFTKMLFVQIKNLMRSYKGGTGLLNQYLHTQLDIIAKSINDDFGLKELPEEVFNKIKPHINEKTKEVKVDYTHATHAKLHSIMQAVKLSYETRINLLIEENTKLKSENKQ